MTAAPLPLPTPPAPSAPTGQTFETIQGMLSWGLWLTLVVGVTALLCTTARALLSRRGDLEPSPNTGVWMTWSSVLICASVTALVVTDRISLGTVLVVALYLLGVAVTVTLLMLGAGWLGVRVTRRRPKPFDPASVELLRQEDRDWWEAQVLAPLRDEPQDRR